MLKTESSLQTVLRSWSGNIQFSMCDDWFSVLRGWLRVLFFVTRDRPFIFPVKCEMGYFFLVIRDFHTSREAWFCKITIRETRNKCLIRVNRDFHDDCYFVNCERTVLFSVKRDLDPPFTTLFYV